LTAATRKQSAVLIPVFRDTDGELRLVLVVRGTGGVHGGKLGLPCGEAEVGDRSPLETALREAAEEIGLTRGEIDVLAGLEPVDTRTTNFRVHPYLARVSPRARLRTALGEISGVLTPSVRALADRAARGEQQFSFPILSEPRIVECVPLEGGYILWGLTLRLLDLVLPRLLAGEWTV
jgi:8-oxo-dGTP pyrophosphatase MutT (NUDIX family)